MDALYYGAMWFKREFMLLSVNSKKAQKRNESKYKTVHS